MGEQWRFTIGYHQILQINNRKPHYGRIEIYSSDLNTQSIISRKKGVTINILWFIFLACGDKEDTATEPAAEPATEPVELSPAPADLVGTWVGLFFPVQLEMEATTN